MRSRHPRVLRMLLPLGAAMLAVMALPQVALAQVSINPTQSPTRDTGGWVYWMAEGAIVLGAIILLLAGFAYLRFSPRFSREDETEGRPRAGVRAPEPQIGLQRSWRLAARRGGTGAAAHGGPAPARRRRGARGGSSRGPRTNWCRARSGARSCRRRTRGRARPAPTAPQGRGRGARPGDLRPGPGRPAGQGHGPPGGRGAGPFRRHEGRPGEGGKLIPGRSRRERL